MTIPQDVNPNFYQQKLSVMHECLETTVIEIFPNHVYVVLNSQYALKIRLNSHTKTHGIHTSTRICCWLSVSQIRPVSAFRNMFLSGLVVGLWEKKSKFHTAYKYWDLISVRVTCEYTREVHMARFRFALRTHSVVLNNV